MKTRLLLALLVACALSGSVWAAHGNPNAPQGGTVYLNLGGEPTTLNPISSTDLYSRQVHGYVLESLGHRDEDTYDWKPGLAESWDIAPDGKSFTFHLRQGVKWHDGEPVTAEDVQFSFDYIFNPKFPTANLRPYYEGIEKVEIVDPKTVKFTTKEKYFGNFDSAIELTVIPKHIYGDPEKALTINHTLVGTGSYMLDKYERGKKIVVKRNPNWWGNALAENKGNDNFDQIVLRFVKEDVVALEMLKKGEIDYEGFTAQTYAERAVGEEWGKKVIKVKAENSASKPYGFIAWNTKNPFFADKNVRIALTHLLNRKLMIQKFQYGLSLPATGPWYQQSEYASKKVKAIDFDPKKALKMLKEAGWEDSDKDGVLDREVDGKRVPFRFTILTSNEDFMKYLTLYKEDASKVGVGMEVKYVEWNTFIKLLDEHKFDAVNLGWGGGSVDLDPKQIWHSSSTGANGSNFISYSNPEVDKLIEEGRKELVKKKRIPKFQKVYELIAADAPYSFLFNPKYVMYGATARLGRPKDTFKYTVGTSYWWVKP